MTSFDLQNWKLTLPVDRAGGFSGSAYEVTNPTSYTRTPYFYTTNDGALVFSAPVQGATKSGSSYARSELREMNGSSKAAWKLSQGGIMSATLEVDAAPHRDGIGGRLVVAQVHGQDEELVRLYWENNKLYFANDQAGPDNRETKFYFVNASGQQPNVSLDERFSYTISAKGSDLHVSIFADGQIYKSVTKINPAWQSDTFYFKAGAYLGANETNGSGYGQASFYDLRVSHDGAMIQPHPTEPSPSAQRGLDIFWFFYSTNSSHFFTASAAERDSIIATLPQYQYEGNAFDTTATAATGDEVFRFFRADNGTHFYTISEAERDSILANLPHYRYEGVAYHAYETNVGGAHEELYRFFRADNGTHFFTTSEAERDSIMASLPHYKYEGVAYYVDLA
jgi:hypothetical protein